MVQYLSFELKEAEPVISRNTFIKGFRRDDIFLTIAMIWNKLIYQFFIMFAYYYFLPLMAILDWLFEISAFARNHKNGNSHGSTRGTSSRSIRDAH